MHTPEKLPKNKGETGSRAAKAPRSSAMSPAAAARGPMTPAAFLVLQRAVGHQAASSMLDREESAAAPADILNAAMASPSRSIESGTLKKAQSYYQNDRLSRGRVHTGPLAQRAVAAFGAEAMTVGEHIFFGEGVEHHTATAFHEYGHLDKNTRGIAETGTAGASGVPVTDPGQHSEREAANDGAAAAAGAEIAPSVVAQRAVGQDAATDEGSASDTAIQRATVQRAHGNSRRYRSASPREEDDRRRRHRSRDYDDDYDDRRAGTSYVAAPRSRESTPGYDDIYGGRDYRRYDPNIVTDATMGQNPSGRRAIDQNTVMSGYSARDILTSAGRRPAGTAAHLHTGAAYALGDGLEGQTQRASNLTPGSQATNLDHKRYEDSVSDVTSMLGVAVTGAGLRGSGSRGRGYDVYDTMDYDVRGPDGRRVITSHSLDLHDYSSAAERRTRPEDEYPRTQTIRRDMLYGAVGQVMDAIHPDDVDPGYREWEERRRREDLRRRRKH